MAIRTAVLVPLCCVAACESGPAPEALDRASETHILFTCADDATVSIRFLGPETIELLVAGGRHVLSRERSASGAKYVSDGITFWNKGDDALLVVGEAHSSCQRASS